MKPFSLFEKSISSAQFSLITALFFTTVFNTRIWQIYFSNEPIESFLDIFPLICFFIFIYFLLFSLFSLFSFKGIQKIALIVFFLISSIALYFSMSFKTLFDESMMQNVMETDFHEASDLLTGIFWLSLGALGILPSIIIYKININYHKLWKQISINLMYVLGGLMLSILILFPFYAEFSSFIRNNNKQLSNSLLPSAPIYALYKNLVKSNNEAKIVKQLIDANSTIRTASDSGTRKPRVIVVIVGETARASSFAVEDAALLNQRENLIEREELVYFNNFWSCGTNTALSVPCMFSMFTRDEYQREFNKKYENVAEIIQRVGYDVSWKENDGGCKGVCSLLNNDPIESEKANQFYHDGEYYDEVLIEGLVAKIEGKQQDQVIFLHQMGSHGPAYYKRVPSEYKKYQPACESANFRDCSQVEIINAYNNTILYTKYVISQAIEKLTLISENYDTALIYLSDHGESTGEKGYYLHGIPYFMAPEEQTHIPALFWMSKGFGASKGIDLQCIKSKSNEKLSHDNFSHSLLGLLDIENTAYKKALDIFSDCTS